MSRVLMNGLAVYVKEGLPFAWDVSIENSVDSYLCFWLTLPHSVSYMFFLCQSPSLSLSTIFDSVWSNTDDVLCINPSANVFVFGDFNIHHKNWLTYSGGTSWWTGSLAFISFDTSICSTMTFPPLGYSDHDVVSVSIDAPLCWQWDAFFGYSCADWDSRCYHLRDVPWEDIFKLSTFATASEIFWVGSGWDWFIYSSLKVSG